MSMGLPAVGYKSCSAVNELIKDGENGYLCDDGVEPLKIALQKIMKNQQIRMQMGKGAKISMEKYSSKAIWNEWNILLEQCF